MGSYVLKTDFSTTNDVDQIIMAVSRAALALYEELFILVPFYNVPFASEERGIKGVRSFHLFMKLL